MYALVKKEISVCGAEWWLTGKFNNYEYKIPLFKLIIKFSVCFTAFRNYILLSEMFRSNDF